MAVRDKDEGARRARDDGRQRERRPGNSRRLKRRRFDGDEDLQVDRVIAIRVFNRDALVLNVCGRMRREVRMHGRRVVIVVIRIDMRVEERRAHGAALNGEGQPEREQAANHAGIVYQNLAGVALRVPELTVRARIAADFTPRTGGRRPGRAWP